MSGELALQGIPCGVCHQNLRISLHTRVRPAPPCGRSTDPKGLVVGVICCRLPCLHLHMFRESRRSVHGALVPRVCIYRPASHVFSQSGLYKKVIYWHTCWPAYASFRNCSEFFLAVLYSTSHANSANAREALLLRSESCTSGFCLS